MKTSFDEFFVGKFTIVFHDGTEVEKELVRYGLTSDGGLICLVDDDGVVYNWAHIAYMIPSKD